VTSETLVNVYQTTRCYNPEDSHLHTHRRENLKSNNDNVCQLLVTSDYLCVEGVLEHCCDFLKNTWTLRTVSTSCISQGNVHLSFAAALAFVTKVNYIYSETSLVPSP
jgi:hypothetical protein